MSLFRFEITGVSRLHRVTTHKTTTEAIRLLFMMSDSGLEAGDRNIFDRLCHTLHAFNSSYLDYV